MTPFYLLLVPGDCSQGGVRYFRTLGDEEEPWIGLHGGVGHGGYGPMVGVGLHGAWWIGLHVAGACYNQCARDDADWDASADACGGITASLFFFFAEFPEL